MKPNEMKKVFLTGGGGAGNEALWRFLNSRYDLHFGDVDCAAIDPSIPRARCHAIPLAGASSFVDEIINVCRRLNIDIIIPGVDEELLRLSYATASLNPTLLMSPDSLYIETMLDKLRMINTLTTLGIRVPHTHSFAEGFGGVSFPCIVKPRSGRGSRGVRTVTEREVPFILDELNQIADKYIVQEFIEGTEYTVQMVANQSSELVAIVPIKIKIKRGVTIQAEVCTNPIVIRACQKIHNVLPTSGTYNIQLIVTNDGLVYPFEINPRISTTYCMTVAIGIDPIQIFIENRTSQKLLTVQPGLKIRRYWRNYFSSQ